MCKYCEEDKRRKRNLIINTPIVALRIIENNGLNALAIKSYNLEKQVVDSYQIINYCPMCRKEAGRVKFESKKKLREDIEKLEKEKKQLIEKRETNYDLYKAIIAIMLRENRKYIEIDFRDVLAADDYELAFFNNPFKTTKEIKLIRRKQAMTNEQREAIELAKEFTKMDFSNPMGWTGYYDAELEELSQAIETVLSLIKEQQEELKKQDRQIDLMADKLVEAHEWFYSEFDNFTKEDFIKYFERKVEEC